MTMNPAILLFRTGLRKIYTLRETLVNYTDSLAHTHILHTVAVGRSYAAAVNYCTCKRSYIETPLDRGRPT